MIKGKTIMNINFDKISQALLDNVMVFLPDWLHGGRLVGKEYTVASLHGGSGNSLKINTETGLWADFATGQKGGDLISLYAAIKNIGQVAAAKVLCEKYGSDPYQPENSPKLTNSDLKETNKIILPPKNIKPPKMALKHFGGEPSFVWKYPDSKGRLMFYIARYDISSGKQFVPWCWSSEGKWICKGWQGIRHLYNLPDIINKPKKPIMVVEGEKAVDSAMKLVEGRYVVTTWSHGAQSWKKTDWSAIYNRNVLIWPDSDEPGLKAGEGIAKILINNCPVVKMLSVSKDDNGWDAADAVAEGWDWNRFKTWGKPIVKIIDPIKTVIQPQEETILDSKHDDVDVVDDIARGLFPQKTFPLDILPEDLQTLCQRAEKAFCINRGVIASMMLTVLSSAIGNSIRIIPKEGWDEPPFLWMMVVGRTGSGKSPAMNFLMEQIRFFARQDNKKYCKEKKEYLAKMKKYEKSLKIKKESVDKLEEPQKPKYNRWIISDTTLEALCVVMEESPRGVLLHNDELAGFVKSQNQYKKKGSDAEKYLELFNCKQICIERVTKGSSLVANTGCAILGGIQPLVLPKVFTQEAIESGLLPRFLFTNIDHKKNRVMTRDGIATQDNDIWDSYLYNAISQELKFDPSGLVVSLKLKFNKEAQDYFFQICNSWNAYSPYMKETAAVFIPKLITYIVRIAGILHVIHQGFSNQEIKLSTVKAAVFLVEYFAGEAFYQLSLYSSIQPVWDELEQEVMRAIKVLINQPNNGMVAISKIKAILDENLPESISISSRKIGAIIEKLGLETKLSGGYSCLIWEPEKIETLLNSL